MPIFPHSCCFPGFLKCRRGLGSNPELSRWWVFFSESWSDLQHPTPISSSPEEGGGFVVVFEFSYLFSVWKRSPSVTVWKGISEKSRSSWDLKGEKGKWRLCHDNDNDAKWKEPMHNGARLLCHQPFPATEIHNSSCLGWLENYKDKESQRFTLSGAHQMQQFWLFSLTALLCPIYGYIWNRKYWQYCHWA